MTENKYKLQAEDIQSMDLNNDTLAKLKQILPEVFSEGADGKPSIDVEKLKVAIGSDIDVESDDKTRYSFNWSGKKQAQALANQPSTATLRPSVEDSKHWDDTQNVYIEGDNLEALKLLQKSYYGQIKMIYIDPPYNTGKDFVYKDNFHDNVKNYLQLTGQVDNEGNKISTNTDKSGRYHTDWLNMMYPRLKLARNLLKDDGVIFISIDDNEVHNLRKICDEIFGEDNFVGQITLVNNPRGRDYGGIAKMHEYIIAYTKNTDTIINLLSDKGKEFQYNDSISGFDLRELRNRNIAFNKDNRPNLYYPFYINKDRVIDNGLFEISLDKSDNCVELFPKESQGLKTVWRWGKDKALENLNINIAAKMMQDGGFQIVEKYRKEEKMARSVWWDKEDNSEKGTLLLKEIFEGKKLFDFPKSKEVLLKLLEMGSGNNDIILDFFSGSATTTHAIMQLNAEDGGKRKYICVQLPEPTYSIDKDDKKVYTEAYKSGYKNICEIGKERIRRAGEKVLAEWNEKQQKTVKDKDLLSSDLNNEPVTAPDIGFKVFKLDSSNIKPFDTNDMFADELLIDGRSALDLFYEIALKQGFSLDSRQCVLDIGGTRCYALVHEDNTPFVLAVLDDKIKANFALELLKYTLKLLIVKDECFGTDEIKLNLLATLEQLQNKNNPLQIRIV